MRRIRVLGIALAALGGAAVGACNLLLGFGDIDVHGKDGGPTGTGGSDDGGQPDGGDAGPPGVTPHGLWSKSFSSSTIPTVSAIAVDPEGNIYLTGTSDPTLRFGCEGDGGVNDTGSAYLVELSPDGTCKWLLRFGTYAQGTGVAVDQDAGTLALTGTFGMSGETGTVTLDPIWTMSSENLATDSFVAVFDSGHKVTWSRQITDDTSMGVADQITTGVAASHGAVAVSAYYSNSIAVEYPSGDGGPGSTMSIQDKSYGVSAVVIQFFDTTDGGLDNSLWITSLPSNGDQRANGVALDPYGNFVVAGTTSGSTSLIGGTGSASAIAAGNALFLGACTANATPQSATALGVFGAGAAQDGGCVAFDQGGYAVAGGQFTGGVGVLGQDGGITYTNGGGESVIVVRYDAMGNLSGSLQFGDGTSSDNASIAGVAPYGDASVAFAGGFIGNAHFQDGGKSVSNPGSTAAVYVAQADSTLQNLLWVERFGGGASSDQRVDAIAVDSQGNIIVAGHFVGTLDFGIPDGGLVNTTGNDALFVAKLAP